MVITSDTITKWWSGKESLLPWIPRPIKVLIFMIFLLNAKSWPFVWHVKVWYPAIIAHIKARRVGLKEYYRQLQIGSPSRPVVGSVSSTTKTDEVERSRQTGAIKEGTIEGGRSHRFEHPFGVKSVKKYTAGFDDCDYNYHLSNSSYAKNLDSARMQACIELFSPLFAPGGWMALGAAHYHYIKEIPIFAEYDIQISIGGFEDKWIYLVGEFVTFPKKGKKSKSSRRPSGQPVPAPIEPTDLAQENLPGPGSEEEMKDRIAKQVMQKKRDDGGVLNCFSVSVYCFKIGRMTIPPRVALSFCGYGNPSNWERAERMLLGTKDRGRKWLQGGWKDEAGVVGEEWTGKEFEQGREEGARLKGGLEGLRKVVDAVPKV